MQLSIGKSQTKKSKAITAPLALGGAAAIAGAGYSIWGKSKSFQKDPWTPIEKAMSASMTGLRKLYERLPQQHRQAPQIQAAFRKFDEAIGDLRSYAQEHRYGQTASDGAHARQPVDVTR
jgi:phage-related minor tail protein